MKKKPPKEQRKMFDVVFLKMNRFNYTVPHYILMHVKNPSFCSEKLEKKRIEAEKRLKAIADEKAKEAAATTTELVVDEKKAAAADLLRAYVTAKK